MAVEDLFALAQDVHHGIMYEVPVRVSLSINPPIALVEVDLDRLCIK